MFLSNGPSVFKPPSDRFSVTSVSFAQHLHSILHPHLPSFAYPASARGLRTEGPRIPHSLNSNIRVYKYAPKQYFGPHYDDSVRDPETGAKSEWTLLIYLTGVEDDVQGGEVSPVLTPLFMSPSKGLAKSLFRLSSKYLIGKANP
jgi:hypothetical protein